MLKMRVNTGKMVDYITKYAVKSNSCPEFNMYLCDRCIDTLITEHNNSLTITYIAKEIFLQCDHCQSLTPILAGVKSRMNSLSPLQKHLYHKHLRQTRKTQPLPDITIEQKGN